MTSHPASFMARGWSLPNWGEYYKRYEEVDGPTPYPLKKPLMMSLALSQMAYQPAQTLVELPWIKLAKFFLVGFASVHESEFHDSGRPHLEAAARASRQIFAPVFLLLAAIGCWHRPRHVQENPVRWAACLLPLMCAAVYLIAGETSPRYSFHIHFALAMLAGTGLDAVSTRFVSRGAVREKIADISDVAASFGAALGLTLIFLIAALALPPLLKKFAGNLMLADMRLSKITVPQNAAISGETVFDSLVPLAAQPADGIVADARIQISPHEKQHSLSFFFWPEMPGILRRDTTAEFLVNGVAAKELNMRDAAHANRIVLPLPENSSEKVPLELRVELRATSAATLRAGDPAFRWGYIRTY
jgi:protein-S-isoprenylcysteine O-methyltransferase Ste14